METIFYTENKTDPTDSCNHSKYIDLHGLKDLSQEELEKLWQRVQHQLKNVVCQEANYYFSSEL